MSAERVLRINTQLVAGETFDTEAVLINLGNGMVYTLDNVGSEMWRMIEKGRSLQYISRAFAGHFSVPADSVLVDLEAIAQELLDEDLVVEDDDNSSASDSTVSGESLNLSGEYCKPKLTKYDDMREVLALDPPLPRLEPSGESVKSQ